MIAVLQRTTRAEVVADGQSTGQAGQGLYLLLGVGREDTEEDVELLTAKIPKLRIFSDAAGKMNLSVCDIGGDVTVVSNFTLYANYRHGNRPDFLDSAPPEQAERLYDLFVERLRARVPRLFTGRFGADMHTELLTDGPITLVMDSARLRHTAPTNLPKENLSHDPAH